MEHKTSVREYLPKIRHHVAVAERHERAARRVKSEKKRKRHVNIAAKHRRKCKDIAKVWGAQTAWNRDNWDYVFRQMYGPISPEAQAKAEAELKAWIKSRQIEDNAEKARTYDFWSCSDIRNKPKIVFVDLFDEELIGAFDWEATEDWTDEDWDKWETEALSKISNESSTEDNPDPSSSQETSTIYLAAPLTLY